MSAFDPLTDMDEWAVTDRDRSRVQVLLHEYLAESRQGQRSETRSADEAPHTAQQASSLGVPAHPGRPVGLALGGNAIPDGLWRRLLGEGLLDHVTRLVITGPVEPGTLTMALRLPRLERLKLAWVPVTPDVVPPSLPGIVALDLTGCSTELCRRMLAACSRVTAVTLSTPSGDTTGAWPALGRHRLEALTLHGVRIDQTRLRSALASSEVSLRSLALDAVKGIRGWGWLGAGAWPALQSLRVSYGRIDGPPPTWPSTLVALSLRGSTTGVVRLPPNTSRLDLRGVELSPELARAVEARAAAWTHLGLSASPRSSALLGHLLGADACRLEALALAAGEPGVNAEVARPAAPLRHLEALSCPSAWSLAAGLLDDLTSGRCAPALRRFAVASHHLGDIDLSSGLAGSLEDLELGGYVSRITTPHAGSAQLRRLSIERGSFDDAFPAWLAACPRLVDLRLHRSKWSDLTAIGAVLEAVSPRIEVLVLTGVEAWNDEVAEELAAQFRGHAFPRLTRLDVTDIDLDDAGFAALIDAATAPRLASVHFGPLPYSGWSALAERASPTVHTIYGRTDGEVEDPAQPLRRPGARTRYAAVEVD